MIPYFGYLDKEWTGFVHSFYYTAGKWRAVSHEKKVV